MCDAAGNCAGIQVICPEGGVCNPATGQCKITCTVAADCGVSTDCLTRTCNAGLCGVTYAPGGTITQTQKAGDCRRNICDDFGNIISSIDNTDGADDNNQCTVDSCINGVASHRSMHGAACNDGNACTVSDICNAVGVCSGFPLVCPNGGYATPSPVNAYPAQSLRQIQFVELCVSQPPP